MDIPLPNLKKRLKKAISVFAMVTLLATTLPLNIYTALAQGGPPPYEDVTVTTAVATDFQGPNMVLLMFDQILDTANADASMFTIAGNNVQAIDTEIWDSKGVILITDTLVSQGETVSIADLPFLTTATLLTGDAVVGDFGAVDPGSVDLNDVTFSGQDLVITSVDGSPFDESSVLDPIVYGDFGGGPSAFKGVVSNVVISNDTITLTPTTDVSAMNLTVCLDGLNLASGAKLLDNCSDVNSGVGVGNQGGGGGSGVTAWNWASNSWDAGNSRMTAKWSSSIENSVNGEYLHLNFRDTNSDFITVENPALVSTTATLDGSSTVTMNGPSIQLYNPGGIPQGDFDYEFAFDVPGGNFNTVNVSAQIITQLDPVESHGAANESQSGFGVGSDPGQGSAEVTSVGVASLDAVDADTVTLSFNPTVNDPNSLGYLGVLIRDDQGAEVTPSNVSLIDTNLDPLDNLSISGNYIVLSRNSGMTSGGGYYTLQFDMLPNDGAQVDVFATLVTDSADAANSQIGASATETGNIGSWGVDPDGVSDLNITGVTVDGSALTVNLLPTIVNNGAVEYFILEFTDSNTDTITVTNPSLVNDVTGSTIAVGGNNSSVVINRVGGIADGASYEITFDSSYTSGDLNFNGYLSASGNNGDAVGNYVAGVATIQAGGNQAGTGVDALAINSITASSVDISANLADLATTQYLSIALSVNGSGDPVLPNGGAVDSSVVAHAGGSGGTVGFDSGNGVFTFTHDSHIDAGIDIAFVPTGDLTVSSGDIDVVVTRKAKGDDGIIGTADDSDVGSSVSATATMQGGQQQSPDVLSGFIYSDVNETILETQVSEDEVQFSFTMEDASSLDSGSFRFYIMQSDLSAPYTVNDASLVSHNLTCDEDPTITVLNDNSGFEVNCTGLLEQASHANGLTFAVSLDMASGPSALTEVKLGVMAFDSEKTQVGNTMITAGTLTVGNAGALNIASQEGAVPVEGTCLLNDADNPPFMLFTSPLHNVPVSSPIDMYFNECLTINQNDIALMANSENIEFTAALNSTTDEFTGEEIAHLQIMPSVDLPSNTPVSLYLKDATDADSNSIPINESFNIGGQDTPIFVLHMFTGGAADFTFAHGNPPWLEGTVPKLDKILTRNSSIALKFNESLARDTVGSDNITVYNLTADQAISEEYYQITHMTTDPSVVIVSPAVPKEIGGTALWPANAEIEIRIGSAISSELGFTLGGEGLFLNYTVNGTTDNTSPTIRGAIIGYGSTPATFAGGSLQVSISTPSLAVKTSEPLDPRTILNGFSCSNGVDCGFDYDIEDNTVYIFFENVTGSSPGDTFTLSSSGVTDLAGNAMADASTSVEFTAASTDDVNIIDFFANPFELMLQFDQVINDSTLDTTNSIFGGNLSLVNQSTQEAIDTSNVIVDYDVASSRLFVRGVNLEEVDIVELNISENLQSKFGGNNFGGAVTLRISVEEEDFFGAHFESDFDQNFWENPITAEPLSRFAGEQDGVLHLDFTLGASQSIVDGDTLVLTVPAGFTFGNTLGEDQFSPFLNNKSLDRSKSLSVGATEPTGDGINNGVSQTDGIYIRDNNLVIEFDTADTFSEGDTIVVDVAGLNNSTLDDSYEFGMRMQTSVDNGSVVKYNLQPASFTLVGADSTYEADIEVVGDATLSGDPVTIVARTHAGDIEEAGTFDVNGVADFNVSIPVAGEFEVFVKDAMVGSGGTFRAPDRPVRMYIDDSHDNLRTINLTKWATGGNSDNQEVTVRLGQFDGSESGVYEIFARSRSNFYGEKITLPDDISGGYVTKTFYLPSGTDYQIGFEPSVAFEFSTSDTGKADSFGDVYPAGPPVHIRTNSDGCFENSGTADDCSVDIGVLSNDISVNVAVVDNNNQGLANATVCMDNPDNHIGICETVGADGTGTIKLPSAGSYNSVAFKSGLPSKETSFFVNANGTVQFRGSTVNTVTYSISKSGKTTAGFKVIDDDGNPYTDAFVACFGNDKPFFNEVHVDSNGRATMWLQQNTNYTCEAYVHGYGMIADLDIEVQTSPLTNKIFRPENTFYTLSGRVSAGEVMGAVSNAHVYVYDPNGRFGNGTETDQDGAYSMRVPAGSYVIGAMDESGLIKESTVIVSDDTTKDITVSGEQYEVTFTIQGASSANGFIHAAGTNGVFFKEFNDTQKVVMKLYGGDYRLDAVFDGKAVTGVTKVSGSSTYNSSSNILSVDDNAEFRFVFASGQTVSFDVTNAGALAYAEIYGNGIHTGAELTNGAGSVSLPSGSYDYRVHSPGKIPLEGAFTVSGESLDVTGTIVDPDVTIAGTASVDGTASDETIFVWGEPADGGRAITTVTDDDGNYTLAAKSNTTYTVKAVRPGFEPLTQEVAVTESNVTGTNFAFDSNNAADYSSKTAAVSSSSGGVVTVDGLGSTTVSAGATDEDVTVKMEEVSAPGTDADTSISKSFEVTLTTENGSAETAFDAPVKYDIELSGDDLAPYSQEGSGISDLIDQDIKYYSDGRWVTEETTVTLYDVSDNILNPQTASMNDVVKAVFSTTTNHATIFGLGSESGSGGGESGGGESGGGDSGGGSGGDSGGSSGDAGGSAGGTTLTEALRGLLGIGKERASAPTVEPAEVFTTEKIDIKSIQESRFPKSLGLISDNNVAEKSFQDTASHWSAKYVASLKSAGVVQGYADGTYKPDQGLTRAELVKIAMTANGLDNRFLEVSDTGFSDVPSNHWAATSIYRAMQFEIIDGYADGTFRPDAIVTRAEATKVLMLASARSVEFGSATKSAFTDVSPSDWFSQLANSAYNQGVIRGVNGKFEPARPVTRGEVAAMVVRTISPSAVAFAN